MQNLKRFAMGIPTRRVAGMERKGLAYTVGDDTREYQSQRPFVLAERNVRACVTLVSTR